MPREDLLALVDSSDMRAFRQEVPIREEDLEETLLDSLGSRPLVVEEERDDDDFFLLLLPALLLLLGETTDSSGSMPP